MLKRFGLALVALLLIGAPAAPALAQGISQKVAVCNPSWVNRCIAVNSDGSVPTSPVAGTTGDVNLKQVNGQTTNVGAGAAGTGTQRVTTSTDSTIATVGTITNSVTVAQATASALNAQVVGNAASGASDAGNPVKVGGVYNSTPPTLTNGQRGDAQLGTRGSLSVQLLNADSATPLTTAASNSDGVTNITSAQSLRVVTNSYISNGTTWDRARTITGSDGTGLGVAAVAVAPTSNAAGAVVPTATTALAGSLVAKASAGNLYAWRVTAGASAGFIMLFNATSAPADGAVTPIDCVAVAANATVGSNLNMPERFSTGITVVFSTTGCFTKTISATAYIRAVAQ